MIWRQSDYFNPALTIANGEHVENTTRTMQDHDLTLFPQCNFKFFMGYSRNVDDGPALSTVQLFDLHGDEYPVFANIHEQQNEYRLGGEVRFMGCRLNVMRGWEDFKQDTPPQIFAPEAGNNTDRSQHAHLVSAHRTRITAPARTGASGLFREGKRYGRSTAASAMSRASADFIDNELASGTNFVGALDHAADPRVRHRAQPACHATLTSAFSRRRSSP